MDYDNFFNLILECTRDLDPRLQADMIDVIFDNLNKNGIYVCRDCYKTLKEGDQCYACAVTECGCGGNFRCCGYYDDY